MATRLFAALLPAIAGSLPAILVAQSPQASDAPTIRLKAATFRPIAGELPGLPAALTIAAYAPGQRGYYLVQSSGPITDEWKAAVTAAGAELLDYVPDFAFKPRMRPADASRVERVAGVGWVGIVHPGYKLAPNLARGGLRPYWVSLERGADISAAVPEVAAAGAQIVSRSGRRLAITANANRLEAIAHVLDVAWIENYLVPRKHNDFGGGAIAGAAPPMRPATTDRLR